MKTLVLFAASFLAQNAPAQPKALLVMPQCGQANMVPVTMSLSIAGQQFPLLICAVLDPAAFRLDLTVSPPMLRSVSSANAGPVFVDGAAVAGAIDGVNVSFLLPDTPNPATTLHLYRNGLRLSAGADFTLAGNAVTFVPSGTPQAGDTLKADYRK